MVTFPPYFTGCGDSPQYNLQISAFPVPNCIIHFADAAAIKVRPLHVGQIDWIFLTLLLRRLQPIGPGFPSLYFDIRC